jgi:hypothetical protein
MNPLPLGEGSVRETMSQSTERARTLRRNMTDVERAFRHRVRDRRFGGLKFRRQVPVGPYSKLAGVFFSPAPLRQVEGHLTELKKAYCTDHDRVYRACENPNNQGANLNNSYASKTQRLQVFGI